MIKLMSHGFVMQESVTVKGLRDDTTSIVMDIPPEKTKSSNEEAWKRSHHSFVPAL